MFCLRLKRIKDVERFGKWKKLKYNMQVTEDEVVYVVVTKTYSWYK